MQPFIAILDLRTKVQFILYPSEKRHQDATKLQTYIDGQFQITTSLPDPKEIAIFIQHKMHYVGQNRNINSILEKCYCDESFASMVVFLGRYLEYLKQYAPNAWIEMIAPNEESEGLKQSFKENFREFQIMNQSLYARDFADFVSRHKRGNLIQEERILKYAIDSFNLNKGKSFIRFSTSDHYQAIEELSLKELSEKIATTTYVQIIDRDHYSMVYRRPTKVVQYFQATPVRYLEINR